METNFDFNTIEEIKFFVAGIPKAMPRCRYRLIKTKSGKQFVNAYTPLKNVRDWYDLFISKATQFKPEQTWDCAIMITCDFVLPRPNNHYNAKKVLKNREIFHSKKPDIDNLLKLVMDVLKSLNYYNDDSQVAMIEVRKMYPKNNNADCGMYLEIKKLTEEL